MRLALTDISIISVLQSPLISEHPVKLPCYRMQWRCCTLCHREYHILRLKIVYRVISFTPS